MIVSSTEIKIRIIGFFILLIFDIILSAFLEPSIGSTLSTNIQPTEFFIILV